MPVEVASAPAPAAVTSMEITVSKVELLRELTATQGVVERKTTIPILSNYLFEAAADKLSLTATDLDLSLRTSCNAKVSRRHISPSSSTNRIFVLVGLATVERVLFLIRWLFLMNRQL